MTLTPGLTGKEACFSRGKDDWGTPHWLFARIDAACAFTLDAAADAGNARCRNFLTAADDALTVDWCRWAVTYPYQDETNAPCPPRIWLNPPYSQTRPFIAKAAQEGREGFRHGGHWDYPTVVCLVAARPDTRIWQHTIATCAAAILELKGRLRFEGAATGAPFPSALVIFSAHPAWKPGPARLTWDPQHEAWPLPDLVSPSRRSL